MMLEAVLDWGAWWLGQRRERVRVWDLRNRTRDAVDVAFVFFADEWPAWCRVRGTTG